MEYLVIDVGGTAIKYACMNENAEFLDTLFIEKDHPLGYLLEQELEEELGADVSVEYTDENQSDETEEENTLIGDIAPQSLPESDSLIPKTYARKPGGMGTGKPV